MKVSMHSLSRIISWRNMVVFLVLASALWFGARLFFVSKPFDTLSGTILLNLAPQGKMTVGRYEFNLIHKEITRVSDDTHVELTGKSSPDGKKEAYVSAPLDLSAKNYFPSQEYLQVHVVDKETGTVRSLTDAPMLRTRLGGWSPKGDQIVYTYYQPSKGENISSQEAVFDLDSWFVDVVDLNGQVQRVDAGSHPVWSPDGANILYLKKDALYLYSLEKKVSEKVYSVPNGVGHAQMKIGVSRDGARLAWSVPGLNRIHLFDVVSWYPFTIKPLSDSLSTLVRPGRIVFWPVWSPDGRYVVFKEGDYDVSQNNSKAQYQKLTVYDTKTEQYTILADLGQYNFDVSFISDWR